MKRRACFALLLLLVLWLGGCASRPASHADRLYVLQAAEEGWALAEVNPESGTVEHLLADVRGFAVGPETFAIVTGDEVLALWRGGTPQPLYECPTPCYDLAWSGDGRYLSWVEGDYGATVARTMEITSRRLTVWGPVTTRPVWAPEGARLALAHPDSLQLWEPETLSETLPLALEVPPAWNSTGTQLAAFVAPGGSPLLITPGAGFPQPLELLTGTLRFTGLSWRPGDEELLLLMQRFNPPPHDHEEDEPHDERPGAETLGAQPWLFSQETRTLRPLPGDPRAAFARPTWSADGRYLALLRVPIASHDAPPEVWVIDVDESRRVLQLAEAVLPGWGR